MTTIIAVTSEETEMEALCSLFYILCIFSFEPPQWFVHLTLQRYFAFSWTKKKEKKFDAKNPLSPSAVASPPLALSYICQQFRNTIYEEEEEGKVKKKKRMKEKNVKTINRISWKKKQVVLRVFYFDFPRGKTWNLTASSCDRRTLQKKYELIFFLLTWPCVCLLLAAVVFDKKKQKKNPN